METYINKTSGSSGDGISLKELILKLREWWRYLLSRWKVVALAGLLGGLLGLTYAWFNKPEYTAECTFVLEEQGNGGGLGQYAGIASMVGIDIGGGGANGIFQGDNIIQLYKSRRMLQQTLLTEAEFNGKKQLLIDRYIEFNNMRAQWDQKPKLKDISFHIPENQFTRQHDSLVSVIVNDLNRNYLNVQKPDKKLSIISVQVKSGDELFAKDFTDAIVQNVNRFYVDTKTRKSMENLQILQKQADSVRQVLNASISGAASAIDANPNANPAMQILRVPSQRRQIDVQASSAIYAEVVKNLEVSRLSARQDVPLIQIVDTPVLPLKKEKLGKMTALVAGIIIFSILSSIVLVARYIVRTTTWD